MTQEGRAGAVRRATGRRYKPALSKVSEDSKRLMTSLWHALTMLTLRWV